MPAPHTSSLAASTAPLSVKQLLLEGAEALEGISPTPRLDAEVLLAHTLGCDRSRLYAWPDAPVGDEPRAAFSTLIGQRLKGIPVAYLRGRQEFWGLDLEIGPGALIPRPETEHLVEAILNHLPRGGRFLDLGTGSGAVALAVAHERPDAVVTATERSPAALAVARNNRDRLGLSRVTLVATWWTHGVRGPFDVIASNPPYIADGDLCLHALRHEPVEALTAGPDGLDAIRALLPGAVAALAPGGILALEHGAEQGAAVATCMAEAGLHPLAGAHDLAGHLRIATGRR